MQIKFIFPKGLSCLSRDHTKVFERRSKQKLLRGMFTAYVNISTEATVQIWDAYYVLEETSHAKLPKRYNPSVECFICWFFAGNVIGNFLCTNMSHICVTNIFIHFIPSFYTSFVYMSGYTYYFVTHTVNLLKIPSWLHYD